MRSRRWILWLFLIVGALVTLSAASVYMLVRGLQLAPASVVTGSTLTLDMRGPLPEDRLFDLSSPFIDVETVTFKDVLDSVERAKDDSRVDSLLVHFRGTGIGWAKAEEIRSALLDFNGSGKKLVSYLEYGGTLDYYLASAADTIHIHPQSILDLRGLNAEVTFMKSTLDKLGIEAEFEQIGAYKNAPDVYTRESLSGPHREALAAIVDDLYDRLVDSIATSRNLSVREVEAIFDRGPFRAGEAQELGLVDELLYKDEVETLLTETGGEFHSLSVAGYQASGDDGLSLDGRHTIALIYGVGVIVGGQSDEDPFFGRIMGADTLAATFKQVREDDSIEAVVFRIQSPGGSDVASDVIWREASLTMEEKPVVVSMADVAASGGYWIARWALRKDRLQQGSRHEGPERGLLERFPFVYAGREATASWNPRRRLRAFPRKGGGFPQHGTRRSGRHRAGKSVDRRPGVGDRLGGRARRTGSERSSRCCGRR
jgi:protease-4